MRPLDPRLLQHASRARVPIGGLALLGLVTAALAIVQAWLLAGVVAEVFIDKATLPEAALVGLAVVTVARAATAWATHALAQRAGTLAKAQLRGALLARVVALGPGWRRSGSSTGTGFAPGTGRDTATPGAGRDTAAPGAGRDTAALTQLATTGLDGLDGYFTSYLPALLLAAFVPLAVLAVITAADPLSGITVAVTLPLVPLFGAFIGLATSSHARSRWRALATLAHHFHDVVAGLPTLRAFGRADAQRTQIQKVTADYRRATMGTLRLAFASSLALELIATMSVALVATEIGLRLAYGHLDLRTGLLVLILAPEAYLPLRALGAQFHATADGLAAAEKVFEILETPAAAPAMASAPASAAVLAPVPVLALAPALAPTAVLASAAAVRVENVSVRHEGRAGFAPSAATFTIVPGRLTVLTGPSGCGKTTLLSALLGLTEPTTGTISPRPGSLRVAGLVPGAEVADGTLAAATRPTLAAGWLPQEPTLFAGTVADNIRLGWPGAPDAAVAAAARDAALDDVGLDRVLGERGTGLSSGQRRRVALARALLPAAPLLLLDEPTAGLDADREATVTATLRRRAAAGDAVVVVTHRPALIAAADTVVDLTASAEATTAPGTLVEVPA
jgi:ATP-binding cassette, subfamily C, bacterial CydCD